MLKQKVVRNTCSSAYLTEAAEIVSKLDGRILERMAGLIAELRRGGGRIFFLGVGGGAGHASHAASDFRKIAGIECYAPTDNVSELTARINDEGWDGAYAAWLETSRLSRKDMIFVFSVSGGDAKRKVSLNLIKAIDLARKHGTKILAVTGPEGGHAAKAADVCLRIPLVNAKNVTAHTEAFQALVWHLLVSHPKLRANEMKWESARRS